MAERLGSRHPWLSWLIQALMAAERLTAAQSVTGVTLWRRPTIPTSGRRDRADRTGSDSEAGNLKAVNRRRWRRLAASLPPIGRGLAAAAAAGEMATHGGKKNGGRMKKSTENLTLGAAAAAFSGRLWLPGVPAWRRRGRRRSEEKPEPARLARAEKEGERKKKRPS